MDFAQLTQGLTLIGVTPPDQLRACLYLAQLNQTKDFFFTTLAQAEPAGLGNGYAFVKDAVRDPNLLNELAKTLDNYVASAVDRDMTAYMAAHAGSTYAQYFTAQFLNTTANNDNITNFINACPTLNAALTQLTLNFQQSIFLACQRVLLDRAALAMLFSDQYPSLTLTGLKKIESSGSDFHKGGQQVLFLTFAMTYYVNNIIQRAGELKVVYKPSDVEIDCLITGKSDAINAALNLDNPFMQRSLVEIFNERVQQMMTANPALNLEKLPTYRFLPCNWLSRQPAAAPLPAGALRNAYGYIEYLGYNFYGESYSAWNLYPFGSSDYLIFSTQNQQAIISKFYRQIGQLVALASTFSITDMHIENVRVNRYQALFIDLEVSLTAAITEVESTSLFDQALGGITGYEVPQLRWKLNNPNGPGTPNLQKVPVSDNYSANRLWIVRSIRKLVGVSDYWLMFGFASGMNVLQQCQQDNDFAAWFARVNNVVVRYVPFSTREFKGVMNSIYEDTPNFDNHFGDPVAATIQRFLQGAMDSAYRPYAQAPTPQPNLIVWQHPQVTTDYQNLDIPVFYHRIGSQDIVDSTGAVVPVQNQMQINILNNASPPALEQRIINVGRATFFANFPTTNNVQQGQVQPLTAPPPAFDNRVQTLLFQMIQALDLAAPPNASVFIQAL